MQCKRDFDVKKSHCIHSFAVDQTRSPMPLTLSQSYQLTPKLILKNRIVMAPMTRRKANEDASPGHVMAKYYADRADAELIVTGSYSVEAAEKKINENKFDLAGMGRPFIANADLVLKIKHGVPLNSYHPDMLKTTLNPN